MQEVGYEYSPIVNRDVLKWPGNARLAVWVGVAIEHYEFNLPSISGVGQAVGHAPDVVNYSVRDYGLRVGIWRIMEVLDRYKIKGTALLNSAACEHYPIIIEEANKRGWEFMAHGITNSKLLLDLPEDEERGIIKTSIQQIEKAVGKRPEGWIGPALIETFNTRNILAEEGIRYLCDWCNDDQPYLMKVRTGTLVAIPYSYVLNDSPAFSRYNLTPKEYYEIVRDEFDVLYEEGAASGRVMSISLHPFIIGLPFRIKYLDKVLRYVASHEDVWFTTPAEIVNWCYEHFFGL